MTPAEEFREYRDWFTRHKRYPDFWLAIILPWMFVIFIVGVPAILLSAFPISDAEKALQRILRRADVGIVRHKIICKLPQGTYIFGYDLVLKADKSATLFGRVCRDVVKGGWVFAAMQDDGHSIPDRH